MQVVTDFGVIGAAGEALMMLLQFDRLIFIAVGVLVGLAIGLLPGIGGLTGFALLVPFTYTMDPLAALGMLLGMNAVTATSDTLPAVLVGVPGEASAQASVLDGFPMSKRGEAARALGAAYTASLVGGIFGAVVLIMTIPVVRPLVLAMGTPEMLGLTVFGIAMVAALSGNAPLRGIIAACFGILIGMVGIDAQTATPRWTGSILYLWDGIPIMPVLLGVFAVPELCDLAVNRASLAKDVKLSPGRGTLAGIRDVFSNWFLVLRCSVIGVICGATPGIGGSVTNWIAYGHAARSVKGANQTFGKGDVRGLIAPESANNALNGGSLIPTLAFGVPASASMAILLGAMQVHGIVPGPDMLTTNLSLTFSMAWSLVLANILGTLICILLSVQLAKLTTVRYTLLLPAIMVVVYIGAFQGSQSWGDLLVLVASGFIGWTMKLLRWPRPPIILGLVLGVFIERYMGISIARFGAEWLLRPGVLILFGMALLVILRPLLVELRHGGLKALALSGRPQFKAGDLLYVFFIAVTGAMLAVSLHWPFAARIGPQVVGITLLIACSISLVYLAFSRGRPEVDTSHRGVHMDLASEYDELAPGVARNRTLAFLGWFVGFIVVMAFIGLIPTVPLFIVAYMRVEGRERWRVALSYAFVTTFFIYLVFDQFIRFAWPNTVLGTMFPILAQTIPSM